MIIHKKAVGGKGLVNSLIDNLKFEVHLPGGYQFCGPGTNLEARKNQRGINPLDSACRKHDYAYSKSKNLSDRHQADSELIQASNQRLFSKNTPIGERLAAAVVSSVMTAKKKMGMGYKRKKRGGYLGLLNGVGVAANLIGGASQLYKTYQTAQENARAISEIKKHNQAINSIVSGKGLYLKPYKGKGLRRRRRKR